MKILVLCTGNSCRSQMAEGYLKEYLPADHKVYSAGVESHGLNPNAVEVMKRDGIDISRNKSKTLDELPFLNFDVVLTVCDNANERCPVLPGKHEKLHHNFEDPAKAEGSEDEIMAKFVEVREQIKKYSKELAEKLLSN